MTCLGNLNAKNRNQLIRHRYRYIQALGQQYHPLYLLYRGIDAARVDEGQQVLQVCLGMVGQVNTDVFTMHGRLFNEGP